MVASCYNLKHHFSGLPASRPLCIRTIVAGQAGGFLITATMIKSLNDVVPVVALSKQHVLFKDISGVRFGRLVAIKATSQKRYNYIWECLCDCGEIVEVLGGRLASGKTTSCGCLKREMDKTRSKTHGHSKSRTYHIWLGMRNRCYNKNVKAYPHYGGRGITICDRWRNSFPSFLEDMGEAPARLSIDRINNDGNYEPSNCRWATDLTQARNCRKNVMITAFGKTLCVSEWAQELGVSGATISKRIRLGLTPEDAITIPAQKPKTLKISGLDLTVSQWSEKSGLMAKTINKRIRHGWTPEAAVNMPLFNRG